MIEIAYHLLPQEVVEHLMMEVIASQAPDYSEKKLDVAHKKRQLLARLEQGDAVIVYLPAQGCCTIIPYEELHKQLPSPVIE